MILTLNPALRIRSKLDIQKKVFEVFSRMFDKGFHFTWTPNHGNDASEVGSFEVSVIIPAKKSKDPLRELPRHTLKGSITWDSTTNTIDVDSGYFILRRARVLFNKAFCDTCRQVGLLK